MGSWFSLSNAAVHLFSNLLVELAEEKRAQQEEDDNREGIFLKLELLMSAKYDGILIM